VAEPLHRTETELQMPAGDAARVPAQEKPATGKALLDALQAEGILGLWRDRRDIADSSSYARELRVAAETRQ
jgi:hypothetical protein